MDFLVNLYLKWDGRICRKTYWIYSIPFTVAFILNEVYVAELNEYVYLVLLALIMYPVFMINIKRSHDRNRTGFFSLLLMIPFVSIWPLIEFGFVKGTEGSNKYGMPDDTWSKP
jgi:uncharacterized membrane protein YhaH (DUF805 family)